jgi:hypothetical protein
MNDRSGGSPVVDRRGMMSAKKIHTTSIKIAISLLFVLLLSGCASVKLVGDYDQQIDNDVTALQKDTESLFVAMEANAKQDEDKAEPYDKHKDYYGKAKVAISGLRVRADAEERNSLTVRMLDKLQANIDRLESADNSQDGITKEEIDKLFRPGLNSQFTAILTFELAKKRGEKPDETKAIAPATPPTQNKGDVK